MSRLPAMLSLFLAPLFALGGIVPLLGEPPSMPGIGEVAVTFGEWGPDSLKYEGAEFLQSGWSHVDDVKFKNADGVETSGDTSSETTVDAKTGAVSQEYSWGNARYIFQAGGARLDIAVAIRNDSADTLSAFTLALPTLKFPAKPAEYDGNTPMLGHNVGAPTAVTLSYGTGTLVLTNDDATLPLLAGFPWASDRPASTVFPIVVNTGRNWMYPSSLPFIDRPIAPGATLEFAFAALRAGGRDSGDARRRCL